MRGKADNRGKKRQDRSAVSPGSNGKGKKDTAGAGKAATDADMSVLRERLEKLQSKTRRQERELRGLSTALEALESTGQAFAIADQKARILEASPAFRRMCRCGGDEIAGRSALDFWSDKNDKKLLDEIKRCLLRDGRWQGEVMGCREGVDAYPVWVNISPLKPGRSRTARFAASVFDLTAIKKDERRLQHMAYYDGLTSLPNRTLVTDRLKHSLSMAQRHAYLVAVIYLDLDRFKEINDTLGHNVGDQMLVETARRLKEQVRESDTVARLGGDEFLVLLPEVGSPQNAAGVAQKILETLREPFLLADHELFISASIGISLFPSDSEDADTLVMNADTAMYHAKAQGKNNYKFFTEDINKSTVQRFILETRFRRALDQLEFQLNYQPKVDMRTGKVSGVEALLRWYHPDQGNVKPSLFIPLAEETGLVLPLGEWALREACRQNRAWQVEGLRPVRISVNISARQFRKQELLELVRDTLKDTGLAPEHLMLEITETAIIDDIENTIHILKAFRQMGVGVSVDDFGTGYSSIHYLKRLPFDVLKIDKSFVQGVPHRRDDAAIVTTIVALARSLDLEVIAEGVETDAQLEFVRAAGCHAVQGFLISRPVDAAALARLVEERAAPPPP